MHAVTCGTLCMLLSADLDHCAAHAASNTPVRTGRGWEISFQGWQDTFASSLTAEADNLADAAAQHASQDAIHLQDTGRAAASGRAEGSGPGSRSYSKADSKPKGRLHAGRPDMGSTWQPIHRKLA